jgi:phage terminase small subunit
MPRKSAAELSVISIDARESRLRPPETLGERERQLFVDLVAGSKASHFQATDLPLLSRYCELSFLAETAAGRLRNEGPVIGGRTSPWVSVLEKATKGLVALSMRLRLSPQARSPNNPTRPSPSGPDPW